MSAEVSTEVTTPGGTETTDHDIKDDLKSTDLCLNVGLGFQFGGRSKTAIFVEGRYSLGLVDINDTDNEEVERIPGEEAPEIMTQGIYLLAGIRF
ncbi:MAG: hypothetical protein KAY24_06470 [Candidatus Eisenbacteria sp.]|nr:hypothetical protein [Candidatus Eisenbacteria bacterium]